jgi:hypothetical protein
MNNGVHGSVVLAASRIRVAINGILEDSSGIIKGMTCSKRENVGKAGVLKFRDGI